MNPKTFQSFREFWPFYLSQHHHPACRLFHYLGTMTGIFLLIYFISIGNYFAIPLSFIPGYGFAWTGHFVFEKNKPAAFNNPVWSFIGDFKMLFLFLTGKIKKTFETAEVQTYLKSH